MTGLSLQRDLRLRPSHMSMHNTLATPAMQAAPTKLKAHPSNSTESADRRPRGVVRPG